MSAPDLFVCGTPGGLAARLVDCLTDAPHSPLDGHGSRSVSRGSLDADAFSGPLEPTDGHAGAALVFLVEDPVRALARVLEADDGVDPRDWLARWSADAQRMRRMLQIRPGCVVAAVVDEVIDHPAGFRALWSRRIGGSPVGVEAFFESTSARPDALFQAAAHSAVASDPSVGRLFSDLQACCEWLDDRREPGLPQPSIELETASLAVTRIRQTRGTDTALERTSGELRSARHENELLVMQLHTVQEELEGQFVARRDAETRLQAALDAPLPAPAPAPAPVQAQAPSDALAASRNECELLVMQLHTVQEELERTFVARRDAEFALQQSRAACVAAEQSLAEREATIATLSAELGTKRFASGSSQAEIEQLRRQIAAQVEREARTVGRLRDELSVIRGRMEAAPGLPGPRRVRFDDIVPVTERGSLPYRELSLSLRGVAIGDESVGECTVRIVEHFGHPGLAIFRDPAKPALIEAWAESGREDDKPYQLLVPVDANCRPMLDALTRQDWSFLLSLTARVEQLAFGDEFRHAAFWRRLAGRLHESLAELPMRFRYDSVVTEAPQDSGSAGTTFRFTNVYCGQRRLEALRVRWEAAASGSRLWLLADARTGPPLPSWPNDEGCDQQDEIELDFRGDPDAAPARARFATMSAADRAFVTELLRAWPHVLRACLQDDDDYAGAVEAANATWRQFVAIAMPAAASIEPGGLAGRAMRLLRAGVPAVNR